LDLFLQLLAGVAGGLLVWALMRRRSLGLPVSAFAGLLGGGLGGSLIYSMSLGATTTMAVVVGLAAAGVGGAVLTFLVTLFRGLVRRR
jgi:uncharacterized membrane protein YeaQ/YmgE (transglycosylase-associated protein family)